MLMSNATSVLSYRTLVWSDAVNILHRKIEIEKIQRKVALRRVHAYRTVSMVTVCVLAPIPPVKLIMYDLSSLRVISLVLLLVIHEYNPPL